MSGHLKSLPFSNENTFTIRRNPWKTVVAGGENRAHERVETDFDQVKHPGQGCCVGCRSSRDAER
jgi:hypothetical protein